MLENRAHFEDNASHARARARIRLHFENNWSETIVLKHMKFVRWNLCYAIRSIYRVFSSASHFHRRIYMVEVILFRFWWNAVCAYHRNVYYVHLDVIFNAWILWNLVICIVHAFWRTVRIEHRFLFCSDRKIKWRNFMWLLKVGVKHENASECD